MAVLLHKQANVPFILIIVVYCFQRHVLQEAFGIDISQCETNDPERKHFTTCIIRSMVSVKYDSQWFCFDPLNLKIVFFNVLKPIKYK